MDCYIIIIVNTGQSPHRWRGNWWQQITDIVILQKHTENYIDGENVQQGSITENGNKMKLMKLRIRKRKLKFLEHIVEEKSVWNQPSQGALKAREITEGSETPD